MSPSARITGLGSALLACVLAALLPCPAASGDVFVLTSGGRIEGRWLNRDARQPTAYEVETTSGGRVHLAKDQVREVLPQPAAEQEYERIAPTFADTAQAQWKLAEWCREHNLKEQRTKHLLRILDYDPNHVAARLGLGFTQVGGQWVVKQQWKKRAGYELYRGRWRIIQEIELLEERSKAEQFEREWVGKLKKIRTGLATDRANLARGQLLEIRDEHAVPALLDSLNKESARGVKQLYIEVLGKIAGGRAVSGLIQISLSDPDVEIFYDCLDQIALHKNPAIVEAYVQCLRNENNVRINRAGIALARLGDKSTIGPLINSLVTTHSMTLQGGTSSDAYSSSFVNPVGTGASPGGATPSGLTAGAAPPKVVSVTVQNPEVFKALVAVSDGASFGYDQRAWARWYAQERSRLETRSTRRD